MKDINQLGGEPFQFFKELVKDAMSFEASDIHITPVKGGAIGRFRIAGELVSMYRFTGDVFKKLTNVIKVEADMGVDETRKPQDGKIALHIDGRNINTRIGTFPAVHGENIVIRILARDAAHLRIDKLGMSTKNQKIIKEITQVREGLVLVCGATGSGKTTTLFSILSAFNPEKRSIFTLENPVEYQIPGYVQAEVKRGGISFDEGLIGLLRQDPNIILIGEIRKKEEAITSLEAANTGHLVFSSVHANTAISVITRLRQLGVESYLIGSGVKYILNQKVVRRLCPHCHIKKDVSEVPFAQNCTHFETGDKMASFCNPDGCEHCINGYKWGTVVCEIIKMDNILSDLISENKASWEILNHIISQGFVPYYYDAFEKSLSGLVDFNECLALKY